MARESIYGDQTEFTQADVPQIRERAGIPPSDRAPTTAQREYQRPFNPVDRGAGGQYNSPFQQQAQRVAEQTSANDPRADYYGIESQLGRLKADQSITKRPEYNVLRRNMMMAPGMTQRQIDAKVGSAGVGLRGPERAAAEAAMRQQLMGERLAIQANNASASGRAYDLVSGRAGEQGLLGQREQESARAARLAPGIQELENASYGRQAELAQAPQMEAMRREDAAARGQAIAALGGSQADQLSADPRVADIAAASRQLDEEAAPVIQGGTGRRIYSRQGLRRLPPTQQNVGFLERGLNDLRNASNYALGFFDDRDTGSLPGHFSGFDFPEVFATAEGGRAYARPGQVSRFEQAGMDSAARGYTGEYEPLNRSPYNQDPYRNGF